MQGNKNTDLLKAVELQLQCIDTLHVIYIELESIFWEQLAAKTGRELFCSFLLKWSLCWLWKLGGGNILDKIIFLLSVAGALAASSLRN